jgi:hypothetical protein
VRVGATQDLLGLNIDLASVMRVPNLVGFTKDHANAFNGLRWACTPKVLFFRVPARGRTVAEADQAKNATGLPTDPHDSGGSMDSTYRSIPNGQHRLHYAGDTSDALAVVEEWYKRVLSGARIDDVNKDSPYGNYFKLDGIRLLAGNDLLNVYRTEGSAKTSIKIFKCRDAPPR